MHFKVMMYKIRNGVIRLKIHDFTSDGFTNVYFISHRYEIFANHIKCQKMWPWKWRSRRRISDLRHSTGNVRFYIVDSFQNFSCQATYINTNDNTHTHTHTYTHSEKQGADYRHKLHGRFSYKCRRIHPWAIARCIIRNKIYLTTYIGQHTSDKIYRTNISHL